MNLTMMTPGPTSVRENVFLSSFQNYTNPDLDHDFFDLYKKTCNNLQKIMHTENMVRILSGEGILGLEAACASLTEKNDNVLVIENGIFGEGFADFVKLYGGNVTLFKGNRSRGIDINELKSFLDKTSNFKYATVVHCDTPSGVLNDIQHICKLLKSKGILTVVDTVSAMCGNKLLVDDWNIDIALCASQKAISAPPGLTILSISNDALMAMKNRSTPIQGFYCNLLNFENYYETKCFPYTMPTTQIKALNTAIENILYEGLDNVLYRHQNIATATRKALMEGGFELNICFKDCANTVTVVKLPTHIDSKELLTLLKNKYNLLLAGSFGYLENKVIRIGHMGENCSVPKLIYTLTALQSALNDLGYKLSCNLTSAFLNFLL